LREKLLVPLAVEINVNQVQLPPDASLAVAQAQQFTEEEES